MEEFKNVTNEAVTSLGLIKEAEKELDRLLDDPENAFLTEIPKNEEEIFNTNNVIEALDIAKEKIKQRLERTFRFYIHSPVEGVENMEVNFLGIKQVVDSIKQNQSIIGEGEDAYVVIDKNEIREFPPEVCYKFSKKATTSRGRNSIEQEADIQSKFYNAAQILIGSKIGVPAPFYSTEIAGNQIIAMEKLSARSVDDILRSKGYLPDWLDIEVFCNELTAFIDKMHQQHLYHRDMHMGNIMITQSIEIPDKWGYVIDFGLSAVGYEDMQPYKKEEAGKVFTYNNDYAIIKKVKFELEQLRERKKRGL